MAVIKSGLTLVARFLPLTINEAGDMTITLRTGYYDVAGMWREQSNSSYTIPAAFMQLPGDGVKTRYEDITTQICQYAIANGYATGTVEPEAAP